jgi:hypothetical protein
MYEGEIVNNWPSMSAGIHDIDQNSSYLSTTEMVNRCGRFSANIQDNPYIFDPATVCGSPHISVEFPSNNFAPSPPFTTHPSPSVNHSAFIAYPDRAALPRPPHLPSAAYPPMPEYPYPYPPPYDDDVRTAYGQQPIPQLPFPSMALSPKLGFQTQSIQAYTSPAHFHELYQWEPHRQGPSFGEYNLDIESGTQIFERRLPTNSAASKREAMREEPYDISQDSSVSVDARSNRIMEDVAGLSRLAKELTVA